MHESELGGLIAETKDALFFNGNEILARESN